MKWPWLHGFLVGLLLGLVLLLLALFLIGCAEPQEPEHLFFPDSVVTGVQYNTGETVLLLTGESRLTLDPGRSRLEQHDDGWEVELW